MVTLSKEPSTLAHTPSLRASLGQVPEPEGLGLGLGLGFGFGLGLGLGFGFGFGLGLGLGLGEGQELQALTRAKKRMLDAKKRASDAELFEPISQILIASALQEV